MRLRDCWKGQKNWGILLLLALLTASCQQGKEPKSLTLEKASPPQTMESPVLAMRSELADLHVLRDYRAMKNSFVLGLEQFSLLPRVMEKGEKKTILDVEGIGSLRHIWQTHGPDPDYMYWEFFVDGEATPSIRGTMEHLVLAAQRCEQPFVKNPGGFIPKESRNFYLPVPFEKSLRIDVTDRQGSGLNFIQLDYRLEDDSLQGIRLEQKGEEKEMQLVYQGALPPSEKKPAPNRETQRFTLMGNGTARIQGPAIIRRLAVNAQREGVQLRIRYDGEVDASVDVDLADFFGPFRGVGLNNNQCFYPMPFAREAVIEISNANPSEEWRIEADVERVGAFSDDWGYFHALSRRENNTTGYLPFQTLYTRGRGHWVGMSLFNTEHDHGGGDFAVIDGESEAPDFLHGINGEDYFSFAFFGRGENFPYSEAFSNVEGRNRLHLENPYPFRKSLQVSWGMLRNSAPRSVSFWYQADPLNRVVPLEEARGLRWEVFGQVAVPMQEDNAPVLTPPERAFENLPGPEQLDDADFATTVTHLFASAHSEKISGWREQRAVGTFLNLMYVYRHYMDLGGHSHMGYHPRAMMARTRLHAEEPRKVWLQFSFDDPLEVALNGENVLADYQLRRGFTTLRAPVELKAGENVLLVRLLDTPNINTAWAGFALRILDEAGKDITSRLQRP